MKISINLHRQYYLDSRNAFLRTKFLVLVIFSALVITNKSYSKNLYFSSSTGNDSYTSEQAQKPETPWRTINKLNISMAIINPGDSILFKRGDIFFGQISLTRSGTASAYIVFSAFGVGKLPVIKGTVSISDWTHYNGNIWVADCPQLGSAVTNFFINGKSQQFGRYPNVDDSNGGYMNIDSHIGSTSVTSSSLLSSINWTGGEAIVRTRRWIFDRVVIGSQSGSTINFENPTTFGMYDHYGFFIQNHILTLDQNGEWFYDRINKKMFLYHSGDPNSFVTEATASNTLFQALGRQYLLIEKMEFCGSLNSNILMSRSQNIIFRNNIVSDAGNESVKSMECSNIDFTTNTFIRANNNAIVFQECENVTVRDNKVINVGLRPGMSVSTDLRNTGIYFNGNGFVCESNVVDSIGYLGIYFRGNSVIIKNNLVRNFCMKLDDGGGIYSSNNVGIVNFNRVIESNIILSGVGSIDGVPDSGEPASAEGIYLDDRSDHIKVLNNTIADCAGYGIFIHNANNCSIEGNTVFNNTHQIGFLHDNIAPEFPIRNFSVQRNSFISKNLNQFVATFRSIIDDVPQIGIFGNNYYTRPIDEEGVIYFSQPSTGIKIGNLTLWQSFSGQDVSSSKSKISIDNINKFRFEYNASKSNKVVTLNDSYVDEKGTRYSGSIMLPPFSSLVLMVDPNPLPPPEPPVYVSAVIQDGAPSIIEINYSLPLANIVPVATAFKVRVNSLERNVNSVAVSGSKVLLRLSSPIVFGNTVTLSYTIPSSNPLQTTSGGQAAGISDQSVINRLTEPIPPPSPVYLSSAIENSTPSVIEMTYNLSLATINPPSSAFDVMVNSTLRGVNSVSVSGTKVLLILSSPVIYGNTVTVAYNKPSSNPLQSTAGGQAATLAAQSVINRVAAPPPPASPICVSSVVENSSPSIIEITFNLTLANIVPPVSAFSVSVNSESRNIQSVSISGAKVLLTLSIPVVNGNTITLSYTTPSTNPIQTPAGGKAASIISQSVINRINPVVPPVVVTPPSVITNNPPVPIVNYNEKYFSGFIGEISASESFDDDDEDSIRFTWKVPDNIPVSTFEGPEILFLAPVIQSKKTFDFELTVSDGKISQSIIVPITVFPYYNEFEIAEICSVKATDHHLSNEPGKAVDGNTSTMWSSKGNDPSLILELNSLYSIKHIMVAFEPDQNKEYYFDIYCSIDGEDWDLILLNAKSCSFSGNLQVFEFPVLTREKSYRFIKLVGLGNSIDNWNYIAEISIFGLKHDLLSEYEELPIKIFPNPTSDHVNIRIDAPDLLPEIINIISFSGKLIYSTEINPGIREIRMSLDLNRGVYFFQFISGGLILHVHKLVII